MSAGMNADVKNFISLFQEIWAECEAFHIKENLEASGRSAEWEECLKSTQARAQELFRPIFVGLERNIPLPRTLRQVQEHLTAARMQRLEASSGHTQEVTCP
jgi:hypothetical protein